MRILSPMATIRRSIVLLACLTLLGACSSGFKKYECIVGPEDLPPDPHAVWACHRDSVRRAAEGKKFTLLEFQEASDFFAGLTSVRADALPTPFGPVPAKSLKRQMVLWDGWYDEHRDELVWDERAGAVRLEGAGGF